MSQTAIQVDNISKLYHLGKKASGSLRETISNALTQRFSRKNHDQPDETDFWALKDVSFTVNQGDVVGIIGKNGAGKSTLLKILSRITEPTTGRILINGRVGSLLEVGTGFHPELSGRENIFLNGSILGMRRSEIQAKFDEIVEFSGIEKFIDTPVKRYSSGMYVRLAFSVAAHLEPEVLIIDEVLAVGDAEFQKKCLGKMQDVAGHGKTVLVVSHNIGTILTLCSNGIYLKNGRLIFNGDINSAGNKYLNDSADFTQVQHDYPVNFVIIDNKNNEKVLSCISGQDISIRIEYNFRYLVPPNISIVDFIYFGIIVNTLDGVFITFLNSQMTSLDFSNMPVNGSVLVIIPSIPLMPGSYSLSLNIITPYGTESFPNIHTLIVENGKFFNTNIDVTNRRQGVYLRHTWGK